MSNKGFTLIELLAVIVILAVIALIATPTIISVIHSSRESSVIRSAELYMNSVELALAEQQINNKKIENGIYLINEDGDLYTDQDDNIIKVKMDGKKPNDGMIILEKGIIVFSYLKLDDQNFFRNSNGQIVSFSKEDIEKKSSFQYDDSYYFYISDLEKLGLISSSNITGYFIFKNNKMIGYNFDIDGVRYDTYGNEELEIVNVKDFGAVGDGVTDDYESIKKAIDYVNENGGKLLFEKNKTYLASTPLGHKTDTKKIIGALDISSNKKIIIDLNGSTLKLKSNNFLRYTFIRANNCTDLTIQNGKIIGDRIDHDYTTQHQVLNSQGTYYRYAAQGYLIYVYSNNFKDNNNVMLRDLEISYSTGDGITSNIYTDDLETNGKGLLIIDNVNIHHNKRMGITLGPNDKVIVKNTYIHDIGDFKESEWVEGPDNQRDENNFTKIDLGISPKAGIDIEPNSGYTNDVVFENLRIENTTGYTIVVGKSQYVNNFKIYNTELHGDYNFPKAEIVNTYFNLNGNYVGNGLHNSTVYNSKFVNTYRTFNIKNSNIYNSKMNGESVNTTMLVSVNSNFTNVIVEGFDEVYKKESNSDNNVIYKNNNLMQIFLNDYKADNTEYINCNIQYLNSDSATTQLTFNLNNLKFENSTIYKRHYNAFYLNISNSKFDNVIFSNFKSTHSFEKINFNSSEINNLMFKYNPETPYNNYKDITINNSKVNNIETEMKLPISVINSDITLDNVNDDFIINDKFICNNSNLSISKNLYSNKVFASSSLINKCIINLKQYNNTNLLQVLNGSSVTVNYEGNETLLVE